MARRSLTRTSGPDLHCNGLVGEESYGSIQAEALLDSGVLQNLYGNRFLRLDSRNMIMARGVCLGMLLLGCICHYVGYANQPFHVGFIPAFEFLAVILLTELVSCLVLILCGAFLCACDKLARTLCWLAAIAFYELLAWVVSLAASRYNINMDVTGSTGSRALQVGLSFVGLTSLLVARCFGCIDVALQVVSLFGGWWVFTIGLDAVCLVFKEEFHEPIAEAVVIILAMAFAVRWGVLLTSMIVDWFYKLSGRSKLGCLLPVGVGMLMILASVGGDKQVQCSRQDMASLYDLRHPADEAVQLGLMFLLGFASQILWGSHGSIMPLVSS